MTLQATIVSSSIWVLYEHLLPFFVARDGMEIMQMEMGTMKEKCWHLPSRLPPKYTHITHTAFSELSSGPVWGVCLFWLSLKRTLTIAAHSACASSFLLSIRGHFSLTGQVLRQEDRMLSANVTNNTGLSNFGRKRTEDVKVVLCLKRSLLWLAAFINVTPQAQMFNTATHFLFFFLHTRHRRFRRKLCRCSFYFFGGSFSSTNQRGIKR